ncbi:MAG: hypothetical protein PHQ27_08075 [Victivallales bacterium]|nr:hypothetical protein [Victivallales bacterium]
MNKVGINLFTLAGLCRQLLMVGVIGLGMGGAGGCTTLPLPASASASTAIFAPPSLEQAVRLEQRRSYLEALKQYRELQETAITPEIQHLAILGQSRCLAAMNNLPLALAVLLPLDSAPHHAREAERAAAAGAIMLRLGRVSQAENMLSAAIAAMPDCHDPAAMVWLAPAGVNLALACRRNGNCAGAAAALRQAAVWFEQSGKRSRAEKCRTLAAALVAAAPSRPVAAVGRTTP